MWLVYLCDVEDRELKRQQAPGSCPHCGGKVEVLDVETKSKFCFMPLCFKIKRKYFCTLCSRRLVLYYQEHNRISHFLLSKIQLSSFFQNFFFFFFQFNVMMGQRNREFCKDGSRSFLFLFFVKWVLILIDIMLCDFDLLFPYSYC